MLKAHKIRLNPTPEQETYFKKACGTARFVWNWALARWKEHKQEHPGEQHGPMALKKEFNAIKRERFPWVYEVTKCACETAFLNLARAFKNYYDWKAGKRNGERVGFPGFKSKKRARLSFTLNNEQFKVDGHWLWVPKLGWVNMAERLRLDGKLVSATISEDVGRWYVSITIEVDTPEPVDFPCESVGVDLGLKSLAVLSDGTVYENQVLLRSELNKLKRLNRELSRRQQGSNRWYRTKHKLARFHKRVRDRRADITHKMTTEIATTYQLIGVEDLNVKGMLRNRRLALSLSDAAFGEIRRQLEYKTRWFGGRAVRVGRFFASSKTCSECGQVNHDLALSDRQWICQDCDVIHDRDWDASKNIEVEALRLAGVATSTG